MSAVSGVAGRLGAVRAHRFAEAGALLLAVLAGALLVGAMALTLIDHESAWYCAASVAVIAPVAAGLLIVLNRPSNRIGWFLLVDAVLVASGFIVAPYAHYALVSHPGALPAARWALLWDSADWPMMFAPLIGVVLIFPDGHLPSRRWRPIAIATFVCFAVVQLTVNFQPQHYAPPYRGVGSPLPDLPAVVRTALTPFSLGAIASLFVAAWAVRVRFRRASGTERLQLLWLTYAALFIPLTIIACVTESLIGRRIGLPTTVTLVAALTVVPLAVGIAVLRYRLFDIELVLSRTLLYASLTACIVGSYLAVFVGVESLVGIRGVSGIVAAAVVALGFQPLRALLQRRVERLVYGDRSDPYAAIARLAEQLQAAPDPDVVLTTIVDGVGSALRLGYCAILLRRGDSLETAVERGRPGREPSVALPLVHQGEEIGLLVVEPAPKGNLSSADRRLLDDLARQAGLAVYGVRLMADLQRSRENLVTAREEERLRLRRDLHDGLGPTLAALVFKIGLIRDGVARDPEHATQLLQELGLETQTAITDIRRLVYELRPPALDELGLVGAVREQAALLAESGGIEISVRSSNLPTLPAAVEATTNATRHANATCCEVELRFDDALRLDISDDGDGLPERPRAGIGIRSMRERALELGGTFEIDRGRLGGTRVQVALPVVT
jgi:signal transduction histidine kinase